MQKLFEFFTRYQRFILFLALELISLWLLVNHNKYQRSWYYTFSTNMTSGINKTQSNISGYFNLKETNEDLANQNAALVSEIQKYKNQLEDFKLSKNTAIQYSDFDYLAAKVIKNSVYQDNNYILLNKGRIHGIDEDMGVVSIDGIVGKVISVTDHYSTVQSFLHSKYEVSSQIKSSKLIGTATWKGGNIAKANLMYIPRHEHVVIQDTVITSGYNAIFPEGIIIGTIDKYSSPPNDMFLNIDLKLTTDFNKIQYVYVIRNRFKKERLELIEKTN